MFCAKPLNFKNITFTASTSQGLIKNQKFILDPEIFIANITVKDHQGKTWEDGLINK